jgi:hypothetical protein
MFSATNLLLLLLLVRRNAHIMIWKTFDSTAQNQLDPVDIIHNAGTARTI